MRDITPLVAPRSVAVIGASANTEKSGGILFKNIVDGGFAGPIHPINPRATEVLGRKASPNIKDAPGPIDLAFVVLPKAGVRAALIDCIAARARAACIITAGFGEIGPEGRREQDELRELVRAGQLLTIGPNTIGTVNAECKLMGSFVPFPSWQSGGVSLFAQTGIFAGAAMVQHMAQDSQRLGIGKSIDVGNKIDVDELDFLHFAAEDAATTVIGLYLEDMRDPDAFLPLAARVARDKPIVVLKPGRTPAGAVASAYHTGAVPMDDGELDAMFHRHGLVRADDVDDFLGTLKAFAYLPRPRGRRVGLITGSGALGVMAVDELVTEGLELARFSGETLVAAGKVVPDWQPLGNPLDTWIAIDMAGPRAAVEVPFEAVLGDPGVDLVLGLLLTPPNADFPEVREVFESLRARHPDVPLCLVLTGGTARLRWMHDIEGLGIAVYPTPRAAARALRALTWHAGIHAPIA
jgi:acyl-CoA synthetase (NDP forming)